jgi:hypothetical protein
MSTYVGAEHLNDEIGGGVHHERHFAEIIGRIYKTTHHHNPPHTIEVVVAGSVECGDQVESTEAGGTAPVGYTEFVADFAHDGVGPVLGRCNSGDLH